MKKNFLSRIPLAPGALLTLALLASVAHTKPDPTPELLVGGKWVLSPVQDCGLRVCAQWDIEEDIHILSCCIDSSGLGYSDPSFCDLNTHQRH